MKIISIEEHFLTPMYYEATKSQSNPNLEGTYANLAGRSQQIGHNIGKQLSDIGSDRLAYMDAAGVDVQVLSFSRGTQHFDEPTAVAMAMDSNDVLHETVKKHPDRFFGFAELPTVNPDKAAAELERSVLKLGLKGAMIHGHLHGEFLDHPKYRPIFAMAAKLDVPIYLHPTWPAPVVNKAYFAGYEELATAAWGFSMDTGVHFLRLLFSGLFDEFPKLKIILGHLGEGIPFFMHRINDHTHLAAAKRGLKRTPIEYIRENLVVTTSGNWFTPAFLCTFLALGADNILFAIDWPYEANTTGVDFLKSLPISETDRAKIAHLNSERILRL